MSFPEGFIWGTATAAHQTEGGNVNSDWWHLEHRPDSPCAESSGDACDSYHRYQEDIDIVAGLGLGSYRFSIEWSRIEPAPGEFSEAQLQHYARMINAVVAAGLLPNITLQHFTVPQWFAEIGGWAAPEAAALFARYCDRVLPLLPDNSYICTINEPNIASCLWQLSDSASMQTAGLPDPNFEISKGLTAAHHAARATLQANPTLRVGWAVATLDFVALDGYEEAVAEYAWERETRFLHAARGDDWLGVQAYTRQLFGEHGVLPVPEGAETTLTGWEYWPQALEDGLREASRHVPGVPLLVTENGIATDNDQRRIDYVDTALRGVQNALASGVDVRGYYYWSLLDNFEWASGYGPTFGLVAVDRQTFQRVSKPSASWFGEVAQANSL